MSEQYEHDRREGAAVEPSGFFRLDRISAAMLVATALLLGVAYVPLVVGTELVVFGYPWLLLSQPLVMIVLGGLFVAATYYGERQGDAS